MQTVSAHLSYGKWLILFLCGIGFAEPSELKACDNHLLFFFSRKAALR
jgi:hypothetical protein